MAVAPETAAALRARLDFLRDIGLYDLYRRGDGSLDLAVLSSLPLGQTGRNAAPSLTDAALPVAALPVAISPVAPAQLAPSQPAAVSQPEAAESGPTILREDTPVLYEEDLAIAARKREVPLQPPASFPQPALPAAERAAGLLAIRNVIGDCTRCSLSETRKTIVFGDGDPNARLLFVGEGPGADEDAQGVPFVGKAGQLLNNMINAMGFKREEVYIANIVKCRPPANRVPEPVEANTCVPFLFEQLGVVRPEVIVALGATAATYLMGGKRPLAGLRGQVHPAFGTKLIVTYHPAYLLRDPRQKKEAWADLQIAMRELGAKA